MMPEQPGKDPGTHALKGEPAGHANGLDEGWRAKVYARTKEETGCLYVRWGRLSGATVGDAPGANVCKCSIPDAVLDGCVSGVWEKGLGGSVNLGMVCVQMVSKTTS